MKYCILYSNSLYAGERYTDHSTNSTIHNGNTGYPCKKISTASDQYFLSYVKKTTGIGLMDRHTGVSSLSTPRILYIISDNRCMFFHHTGRRNQLKWKRRKGERKRKNVIPGKGRKINVVWISNTQF